MLMLCEPINHEMGNECVTKNYKYSDMIRDAEDNVYSSIILSTDIRGISYNAKLTIGVIVKRHVRVSNDIPNNYYMTID